MDISKPVPPFTVFCSNCGFTVSYERLARAKQRAADHRRDNPPCKEDVSIRSYPDEEVKA